MLKNLRTRASVFGPLISVLAVILGLVLVGPINSANADEGQGGEDCVPAAAVPASLSDWAIDHYTEWSPSDIAPVDPDGDVADDPANLTQVGAREEQQVSNHDGYDEAVAATSGQWWNWSPNKDTQPFDGPPAFPSDARGTWEGPHTEGGPDQDASGTFNASNENSGNSSWFHREPGTPAHIVHHPDTTHTEYRWPILTRTYTPGTDGNTCNPEQPAALIRTVPMSESGCKLGGVHSWNDVYTTPFVWNAGTTEWVPGTETGPVSQGDVFTAYTVKQLKALSCVEVAGEQGHQHQSGGTKHQPEVKGEQAHAPAAAVVPAAAAVPSEVEAGLAGTPAGIPTGGGSNNLPLWALSMGVGMFLIGAGRLRRTSRATR